MCIHTFLKSANCLVYLHFRYKCFKLPGATPAEDVAVWFVCWMNWVNVSGHVPISHADLQQRELALSILFWVHPNQSSQRLLRPAAIYLLPSSSTSSSVQGTPCSFAFQDKLRRSLSLCATLAPFLRAQVHTVQGLGPRLGFQLCWAQSVVWPLTVLQILTGEMSSDYDLGHAHSSLVWWDCSRDHTPSWTFVVLQ